MKIHAHILAWNEEKILPFTLDYYSTICEKIFVYDNMSTDSSDEIYKRYNKVEVVKWESNNEINELNYVKIKSEEYKKRSRNQEIDWVIICDCDEILYHENLIEKLKEYKENGITYPKVEGHDMFSETFPIYDGELITKKIKYGSEVYEPMSKQIIVNPYVDVQYGIGAHKSECLNCKTTENAELKLLHYKFIDFKYVLNRYRNSNKRLSDFNKRNGFGSHYTDNNAISYTEHLRKNKIKVI
jgi:hypothetical protein